MALGTWSNGPGETYPPHSHPYHKSLRCDRGSIEFVIFARAPGAGAPTGGRRVSLKAGDTLEIPPGTVHSAVVGPDGVRCTEVHSL
jgi:quercetin dioxygenase-like cupin family protein